MSVHGEWIPRRYLQIEIKLDPLSDAKNNGRNVDEPQISQDVNMPEIITERAETSVRHLHLSGSKPVMTKNGRTTTGRNFSRNPAPMQIPDL